MHRSTAVLIDAWRTRARRLEHAIAIAVVTAAAGCSDCSTTNTAAAGLEIVVVSIPPSGSPGSDVPVNVKITRLNGFTGAVAVVIAVSLPQFTADAVLIPAGETTGTLIIHLSPTSPLGTNRVGLGATGYQVAPAQTFVDIIVLAAGSYNIAIAEDANTSRLSLKGVPGSTIHALVTVARQDFTLPITLHASAPAGMTTSLVVAPTLLAGDATTGTLDIGIPANAPAGDFIVTVTGSATGTANKSGDATVTVGPGSYALSASPASLVLTANSSGQSTVTMTRDQLDGDITFTAPVMLSVTLPSGATGISASLTATDLPGELQQQTQVSTLNVTAGPGVTPGTYPITIHGAASGQFEKTTTVNVVVPTPIYALSVQTAPLTLPAGTTSLPDNVTVTRTNFTGAITLSGSGETGSGITVNFTSQPGTGNSGTFTVTVPPGLAARENPPYQVTLTGTSSLPAVATTFAVVVPAVTNTTWSFCPASGLPLWVAVQDGTAAWTQATSATSSYAFQISSSKGGIAYAIFNGQYNELHVFYGSQAELQSQGLALCPYGSGAIKTIVGSTSNTGTAARGFISLGSALAAPALPASSFQVLRVPPGQLDLIAATADGGTPPSLLKMLVRRGVNLANNGSLGALDFTGAESFVPAQATLTLANTLSESINLTGYFHTSTNVLSEYYEDGSATGATSRTLFGVPTLAQNDLHYWAALANSNSGSGAVPYRTQGIVFAAVAAKALTFGPALSTPIIFSQPAGFIERATVTVQSTYNKLWQADYDQISNSLRFATVQMTNGYLVAGVPSTVNIDLPNLTSVAGWLSSYGLAAGAPAAWKVTASSWSTYPLGLTFVQYVDGATFSSATVQGTVTP